MFKKNMHVVLAGMLVASSAAFGQAPGFLGIRPKVNPGASNCLEIDLLADDGPSGAAGLAEGDIILKINGVAIDCANLPKGQPLVPEVKANDRVVFGILRQGQRLDVSVVAMPLPPKLLAAQEEAKVWQVGKTLLARFRETGESFSITKLADGNYKAAGQFTEEEARYLSSYFENSGTNRGFDTLGLGINEQVELTLRWDPVKKTETFEFANKSVKP